MINGFCQRLSLFTESKTPVVSYKHTLLPLMRILWKYRSCGSCSQSIEASLYFHNRLLIMYVLLYTDSQKTSISFYFFNFHTLLCLHTYIIIYWRQQNLNVLSTDEHTFFNNADPTRYQLEQNTFWLQHHDIQQK